MASLRTSARTARCSRATSTRPSPYRRRRPAHGRAADLLPSSTGSDCRTGRCRVTRSSTARPPDTGGLRLDETAYPILMDLQAGLGRRPLAVARPRPPPPTTSPRTAPRKATSGGRNRRATRPRRSLPRSRSHRRVDYRQGLGDPSRSRLYQAAADYFQRTVKSWDVTTTVRTRRLLHPVCPRLAITTPLSATASATAAHDGPASVVDGGFQELVRLGELPVTDPAIQASLAVLDHQISVKTPSGPGYYRYGTSGQWQRRRLRRLLPPTQLVHEARRALANDRHRHRAPVAGPVGGACRSSARAQRQLAPVLLNAMSASPLASGSCRSRPGKTRPAASTYAGDPTTASIGFIPGKAAGSASPLTWAQAQELGQIADLRRRARRRRARSNERPDTTQTGHLER